MESIIVKWLDLCNDIFEVNPLSCMLFAIVTVVPLFLLSIPIDLIRVLLSKLK